MTSFSDSFPVDDIFDVLGDDAELIQLDGSSETIKVIPEQKYKEDSVGNIISIEYPVLEVKISDVEKIKKDSTIQFPVQGKVYNALKVYPNDEQSKLVELGKK